MWNIAAILLKYYCFKGTLPPFFFSLLCLNCSHNMNMNCRVTHCAKAVFLAIVGFVWFLFFEIIKSMSQTWWCTKRLCPCVAFLSFPKQYEYRVGDIFTCQILLTCVLSIDMSGHLLLSWHLFFRSPHHFSSAFFPLIFAVLLPSRFFFFSFRLTHSLTLMHASLLENGCASLPGESFTHSFAWFSHVDQKSVTNANSFCCKTAVTKYIFTHALQPWTFSYLREMHEITNVQLSWIGQ